MKRQSKAEEALNKQIASINRQIDSCNAIIREQETKRTAFREALAEIDGEVHRLYQLRVSASKRNKPGAD